MTIASCYISPEGVVFGADSTTTYAFDGGNHYFNHAQKLFEIGEDSTLAILTWGLGYIGSSYRTLIALLDDDLKVTPATSVDDVALRWVTLFWNHYTTSPYMAPQHARLAALHAMGPFDPAAAGAPGTRTKDEENEYQELKNVLVVGFCIGGYVKPDRTPKAFEILFDPLAPAPAPTELQGQHFFWGAPNMIERLLLGCDTALLQDIMNSGMWTGTDQDLLNLVKKNVIWHPVLPIRDAIDFTHACIASTIKSLKFSSFSQICGGPIELAVITTDRNFRWVRHKPWDTAIRDGELS